MILVSGLTKVYGSQKAVDNISFSVNQGEIMGFLGPNGAGKSTTMKIITGFLPATTGKTEVCGFDVASQSLEVRKNIGYLPEHNPLYLDMYVKEYLHFTGSLYGMKGKILKDRTQEIIETVGLSAEQHKKAGALSKGYRQRVGLAAALIHNPPVLVLDEPTTGLDPNQIVEIRNLIKNIGKEKTVIFSTHLMQEVEAICNKVIIINKGRMVADGSLQDLQKIKQEQQSVLVAEFAQAIDLSEIKELAGIISVNQIGNFVYEITSKTDIRTDIFRMATQHNWTLIGLKQQESSLESVFQELTR
jgi:ABC-2 type transport system ATP-binding protein